MRTGSKPAVRRAPRSSRRIAGNPGAYLVEVAHALVHGLSVLLLLLAMTIIVEHFEMIPSADAWFAKHVAAHQQLPTPDATEAFETSPFVAVLQLEADEKLAAREQPFERLDPETMRRTRGVRPLNRSDVAKTLEALKELIESKSYRPRIIALDFDVTPLEGEKDAPSRAPIIEALQALRLIAPVVAVVTPRSDPSFYGFMADAKCTEPGDKIIQGLFFASTDIFSRINEPPLRFPMVLANRGDSVLPPFFPSLGVSSYLLERSLPPRPNHSDDLAREAFDDAARAKAIATLTAFCSSVARRNTNALFEQLSANAFPHSIHRETLGHDKPSMYNWRVMDGGELPTIRLPFDLLVSPPPDLLLPRADILIVGASSPGTSDRYWIPYFPGGLIQELPGTSLHAAAAATLAHPIKERKGLGADLIFGIAFVVTESLFAVAFARLRPSMPSMATALSAATPLCIAYVLTKIAVVYVARQLASDEWTNPIFIIVGIAAHAYLGQALHGNADEEHSKWWIPFTYGISRVRLAIGTAKNSQLSRREYFMKLIDAGLSAGVRLAILAYALLITGFSRG